MLLKLILYTSLASWEPVLESLKVHRLPNKHTVFGFSLIMMHRYIIILFFSLIKLTNLWLNWHSSTGSPFKLLSVIKPVKNYINLEKGFSFGFNKQWAKYFLLQHAQHCFIDMLQIKRFNKWEIFHQWYAIFLNDPTYYCLHSNAI